MVNKENYKRIFWQYGGIYSLNVFFFCYSMVILPEVLLNDWPAYLFRISAAINFIFVTVLSFAYLKSFLELKNTLKLNAKNYVSNPIHIIYVSLLWSSTLLEVGISLISLAQFTKWYLALSIADQTAKLFF